MNADDFSQQLWKCAPTLDVLIALGVTTQGAVELQRSFKLEKKTSPEVIDIGDGVLNELFSSYETKDVRIAAVNFETEFLVFGHSVTIGWVDGDVLALNKASQEICVYDCQCLDHVLWHCAANSSCFLSALIEAARFSSMLTLSNAELELDQQLDFLHRCTIKAGGAQYMDFYRMLLGVEADIASA